MKVHNHRITTYLVGILIRCIYNHLFLFLELGYNIRSIMLSCTIIYVFLTCMFSKIHILRLGSYLQVSITGAVYISISISCTVVWWTINTITEAQRINTFLDTSLKNR